MVAIREWWAGILQRHADHAVNAVCDDLRDQCAVLDGELVKANDRIEALQTQVEFLMLSHEVNISLLNKMNATHGFDSNKHRV